MAARFPPRPFRRRSESLLTAIHRPHPPCPIDPARPRCPPDGHQGAGKEVLAMENYRRGVGSVIDAPADPIDWAALNELAPRLGPHSRGLIAARNVIGLRSWACRMAPRSDDLHPAVGSVYRELAELLDLAPSKSRAT